MDWAPQALRRINTIWSRNATTTVKSSWETWKSHRLRATGTSLSLRQENNINCLAKGNRIVAPTLLLVDTLCPSFCWPCPEDRRTDRKSSCPVLAVLFHEILLPPCRQSVKWLATCSSPWITFRKFPLSNCGSSEEAAFMKGALPFLFSSTIPRTDPMACGSSVSLI